MPPEALNRLSLHPGFCPPSTILSRLSVTLSPRIRRFRAPRRRTLASTALIRRGETRPPLSFSSPRSCCTLFCLRDVSYLSRQSGSIWLDSLHDFSTTVWSMKFNMVFGDSTKPGGSLQESPSLSHPGHRLAKSRRRGNRRYRTTDHYSHSCGATAAAALAASLLLMLMTVKHSTDFFP